MTGSRLSTPSWACSMNWEFPQRLVLRPEMKHSVIQELLVTRYTGNNQTHRVSQALYPQNNDALIRRRHGLRSRTTTTRGAPVPLRPWHLWGLAALVRGSWLAAGQHHRSYGESPRHGLHFQVCGRGRWLQQGFPKGSNSFQQLTDNRAFLGMLRVFHTIQMTGTWHLRLISLLRGTAVRHQPQRRRRHLNVLIFPDVLIPAPTLHSRAVTVVGRIRVVFSRLRA